MFRFRVTRTPPPPPIQDKAGIVSISVAIEGAGRLEL